MIFLLEDIGDRFGELKDTVSKYSSFQEIKFRPFAQTFDITLKYPYEEYFPLTSVNTMLLMKKLGSKVFFNESQYDYIRFGEMYGENFINEKMKVVKFSDLLNLKGESLFIRDAYGDNIIKGRVKFGEEEYQLMYGEFFGRSMGDKKIDDDYPIVISPPVNIESEYRFFVVNNEIVTSSMYHINREYWIKNIDDRSIPENDKLWTFAEQMKEIYSPEESFVLDIAILSDGTMKVLECNCLNCSGFYSINMDILIKKIVEAYFGDLNGIKIPRT